MIQNTYRFIREASTIAYWEFDYYRVEFDLLRIWILNLTQVSWLCVYWSRFCVSFGCLYLAIKQSCSYDTNNWHHGQNTYRFIPEASNYTEHPEWDHYSNYPFLSHKFLVSEIVKMNGQESVNSYRENTKKWGKNK